MKKRCADIIMETLLENGIDTCFGVVGGGAMHLDNALALADGIKKIFNHHEQASAMAAEAYARLSGKMAAVCVTSGPGGTNTLTGVMGAWQDSIPMIVLSGQVRYETTIEASGLPLRYRGQQEFNITDAVGCMTKYAFMIKDPLDVKRRVNFAVKTAMCGRRGPVWLDIPLNIQSAVVETNDLYPDLPSPEEPDAKKEDISLIYSALKSAKRPVILAGTGIISGGARDLLRDFLSDVQLPVIGGAWAGDVLPKETDLYYGLSGNIGPRTGNFILQNADVILCLGSSLSYRQTGFNQEKFASKAKIIMVDADPNEPKKPGLNIDTFVFAELKKFFYEWKKSGNKLFAPAEWKAYCDTLRERFSPFEAIEGLDMKERVCSYYFWYRFEEIAPRDTLLALGVNTANTAKLQTGCKYYEQRALTNYTCGSMGQDLPYAIGAAVYSGKRVICATGDGSIMMNLQELQTIKHYSLPVHIIVFSNDGYNAIRQTCKNFFNGVGIGCNKESGISFPSFEKVADAFGFKYSICHDNASVDEALKWLFSQSENAVLEVEQRLDDPVTPKVMSRINADGTFSTPALHDMAPFISEEELQKLMISER